MPSNSKSLSATQLAVHHHLKCDLYLYNSLYGSSSSNAEASKTQPKSGRPAVSELTKAQFRRGNEWEAALLSWLDQQGLLLRVRSSAPLNASELQDMLDFDDRTHFFVTGLSFVPPNEKFAEQYKEKGFELPVEFGVAKPDLVEVMRGEKVSRWQVIDAKASKDVKASHHVQTYFYHMCLEKMLSDKWYTPMGKASIWIAPEPVPMLSSDSSAEATYCPSFDTLRPTPTSLLSLTLDSFFFKKLPSILQTYDRSNIAWHYNPLCKGCPYEADCSARADHEGELGAMPNLSIQDAEVLKTLLSLIRRRKHPTDEPLPDIEELHHAIRAGGDLHILNQTHASIVKRAKRILRLPERQSPTRVMKSPMIDAVLEKQVKVIEKRNFTLPKNEDIAIVISFVLDPATNGVSYFCVSIFSQIPSLSSRKPRTGTSLVDFIKTLSITLRFAFDLRKPSRLFPTPPTCQCFVYSIAERAALQRLLVQATLTCDPLDEDLQASIQLCVGALCEGAAVLATTFQPLILSGALLDFLGRRGNRSRSELLGCLERLGMSGVSDVSETNEMLRQKIEKELQRVLAEGGRSILPSDEANHEQQHQQRQLEIGLLPRVVTVEREVKSLLALPIAGYYDLSRCHAALTSKGLGYVRCPTDEEIFTAYREDRVNALRSQMQIRNSALFSVIQQVRIRVEKSAMQDVLVNDARVLSSNFMDLCKHDHLRKLFFMQQFEVLSRLNDLWQTRIRRCPDAAILQYRYTHRGNKGNYLHFFALISGNVDLPSEKEKSFFNYILTEDDDNRDIPVEALFNDLGVYNAVFPLNTHNRHRWSTQPKQVRESVFVADVQDLHIKDNTTMVVAKTFGEYSLRLKQWSYYRLSPRYVDFNLTKVLSTLVDMDLKTPVHPGYMNLPPFLQLCSDPRGFADQTNMPFSEGDESTDLIAQEKVVHNALRDLKNLDVSAAASLLLKDSQRRALRRVLTHRLAIIWGPPGTGKTYTLSLALLRLLEIRARCFMPGRQIIFVSALTHAAIRACLSKIKQLQDCYRELQGWPQDWLDNVQLEHITAGAIHRLPQGNVNYIYAGTVFQLHNFSKRLNGDVDCVVIDEAGQLGLGYSSLVLKAVKPGGRVIIAGDSEQLAPILQSQYPVLETRLFGSVLDCLMYRSKPPPDELAPTEIVSEEDEDLPVHIGSSFNSNVSTIVQLTENFRLNRDLGEFIQTIYSKGFEPMKQHTRQIAEALEKVSLLDSEDDPIVDAARTILGDLSSAMLRRKQSRFTSPKVRNKRSLDNLEPDSLPLQISLALVRLSVTSQHMEQLGYEAHVRAEAFFAAALVRFIQAAAPQERIFVATPHRIQRYAVNEALRSPVDDLSEAFGTLQLDEDDTVPMFSTANVTVDTIERLQGSEASFVICLFSSTYSSVSSTTSLDFLLERRRLNVAISRARALCILVTSNEVLRPSVNVLTNQQSAKGFAFLKAYEDRAWTTDVVIDIDRFA